MVKFLQVLGLLVTITLAACQKPPEPFSYIESNKLRELSGFASSLYSNDRLWGHNDSGAGPYIYAIKPSTGKIEHRILIQNAHAVDWEDIDSFSYKGENYLVIADIGDNDALFDYRSLYLIKEPELSSNQPETVTAEFHINFRYEKGPRDCESIVVDEQNRTILLLSKRRVPAELFELPLILTKTDTTFTARQIAYTGKLPQPTQLELHDSRRNRYQAQPTAIDLTADGKMFIVLTPQFLFFYPRESGTPWHITLAQQPIKFVLPFLKQAESMCLSTSNDYIYVSSEKTPNPIYRFAFPQKINN